MRNSLLLPALVAVLAVTAGCTRTPTPAERAVEEPREAAPAARPADIGLDEEIDIPDIEVDTETRIPER